VFVLVIQVVIGCLVLVIGFYLQFLVPEILGRALFAAVRLFVTLAVRPEKTRKSTSVGGRPASSVTHRPKIHKSELKLSNVVGAMDGRCVLLEISFGEGFHQHRTAIAWVDKPRAEERLPRVTFVLSPPDNDRGETYLIEVPDEQLGDFEEVENCKRVYRLTSVLYVDVSESEEILI
jgi:hypothetical protein